MTIVNPQKIETIQYSRCHVMECCMQELRLPASCPSACAIGCAPCICVTQAASRRRRAWDAYAIAPGALCAPFLPE